MSKDFFEHKAGTYEKDDNRVSNVENIANSIIASVSLDRSMHLMDFGSGTGLLLERIAPLVNKISAVDISKSMNAQLAMKQASIGCEVEILEFDLATADVSQKYDGVVSSMTMHHVQDVAAMFLKFHSLLNDGGFIAISDLDSEDGNFHTEDTGVYHSGFERDLIAQAAKQAGFRDVQVVDASTVRKPHGEYSVFLLTAKK